LADHGYDPAVADSGERGLEVMQETEPDLVVLDYRLPKMDGLEVLREIRQLAPHAAVVMLTAHGTVTTAVEAMRGGAFASLTEPIDLEELELVLGRAWSHARLERELRLLQAAGRPGAPSDRIVGESEATRQLRVQVERLAALDLGPGGAPPVLI